MKEKTVFILGAGASDPFGYPAGEKLREQICDNFSTPPSSSSSGNYRFFEKLGHSEREIAKFRDAFFESGMTSMDAFLEISQKKYPEFIKLGKRVIAYTLIPCERKHYNLFNTRTKGNWYIYLSNRMKRRFRDLQDEEISFITFNYDRSLEYYLYKSISHTDYGKTPKEAKEFLKKIPIVHVYGQLGYLSWQNEKGYRDYDGNIGKNYVQNSAEKIKIISENNIDVSADPDFNQAHSLLMKTDRIYFLGFAYDKRNLDRLHMKDYCIDKTVRGTAYKLEPSRRRETEEYFNDANCKKFELEDKIIDALGFLENHLTVPDIDDWLTKAGVRKV